MTSTSSSVSLSFCLKLFFSRLGVVIFGFVCFTVFTATFFSTFTLLDLVLRVGGTDGTIITI
ncbi:hypothetical protein B484DRAFT_410012 [Ochromonadaceae sp. CCMP2298]|nr:hypothetical protein B484DRAFT_410012 [Ochromonadaceae sp. CCMP2298]